MSEAAAAMRDDAAAGGVVESIGPERRRVAAMGNAPAGRCVVPGASFAMRFGRGRLGTNPAGRAAAIYALRVSRDVGLGKAPV